MQQYIVGFDIGSRSIKAAVGEVRKKGQLTLLRIFKTDSQGVRKGAINDLSEATQAVNYLLGSIRRDYKNAVKHIYLGVGGGDVKLQSSTGVVAVSRSDSEIYQDDISRAIQGSQAINLPPNRTILHFLIQQFIVDDVKDVKDPLGMIGSRLEVEGLVVHVFQPVLKNLSKCIETSGGSVAGLVLSPLADAQSVLSKNQKELGVVLVDIGFGKTGMAVFEENKLLSSAMFPIGSSNVTNDLAIGLKIPVEVAETIKLSFGYGVAKEVSVKEVVDLSKIDENAKGLVSKRFIAEIIEIRLQEIFELINAELKRIQKDGRLPAGVVLTGAGSKLPGLVDLVKRELKLPAQVGIPHISQMDVVGGELGFQAEDPEFSTALGLLLSGSEKLTNFSGHSLSFTRVIRNIVKYLIP
ncbi:MAG: cell division protein FtsA [Candidatus Harrisonbacteria bacterium CG10_big_fil_rev_8_21_14_0_10_42_17]|uniref:Cell division protein FtsA n=1 Tax=Candidatus Harrisonbacteria bacterium CG10_big_fil_rev_8_21_14_0_10_42_17 TaxID=1974584 RepID=A0A2M6WIH6_9BACT|nr:MAG: cell division protein FtsA [Candidatus Harrisonbacteria bacterium CG10_big_fil_rev_8_21_14_0_10_42_17]